MQHWTSISTDSGIAIDSRTVCHLLNAIGSADHSLLASSILQLLNHHVAMDSCSVMAHETEGNSRLISAYSLTQDPQRFHAAVDYARPLLQHDRIQLHLQTLLPRQEIDDIAVHRQTLTQVIDAELRRHYHDRLCVVDIMAITIKCSHRRWVSVNLCRHRNQGRLDKQEIDSVLQLTGIIASAVSRHCRLEAYADGDCSTSVNDGINALCSLLTQRERQVILRILDGATVEKIAAGLGLKPTTVITYRSRAYEKLGIRSRRELFSAVLHKRNSAGHWHQDTLPTNTSSLNRPVYATSTVTDRPHQ